MKIHNNISNASLKFFFNKYFDENYYSIINSECFQHKNTHFCEYFWHGGEPDFLFWS